MPKVMLGSEEHPVRFSYANVWEAKASEGSDKLKYSVSILIDKKDKASLSRLKKAIEQAKEEGKASKWGGKVPKNLKGGLHDGDEDREDDEVYEGKMFINSSSKNRPGLLDRAKQPIIDEDEFYSGCYGMVTVSIFPYEFNGNKGVTCLLNNILKLKDGEKLGGGASAESDFADFESEDEVLF